MLRALVLLLRSIGLLCCGHRAVAIENLALRQQLAALTRKVKRPQLRRRDRLFWILLAKRWREWRTALMVVQPGERHLRRTLAEFVAHYHGERNHQGFDNELIDRGPALENVGRIRRRRRLGGLLNYYCRAA